MKIKLLVWCVFYFFFLGLSVVLRADDVSFTVSSVAYDPNCPENYGYDSGKGLESCYDSGVDLYYNIEIKKGENGMPDLLIFYRNAYQDSGESTVISVGPFDRSMNVVSGASLISNNINALVAYGVLGYQFWRKIMMSMDCCLEDMVFSDQYVYAEISSLDQNPILTVPASTAVVILTTLTSVGLTILNDLLFGLTSYEGTCSLPYSSYTSEVLSSYNLVDASAYYQIKDPEYGHTFIVGILEDGAGYIANMTLQK